MLCLLVLVYLRSWKNGFTMNKWLRYFADQLDNFNPSALVRRILKGIFLNILLFIVLIIYILLILFFNVMNPQDY